MMSSIRGQVILNKSIKAIAILGALRTLCRTQALIRISNFRTFWPCRPNGWPIKGTPPSSFSIKALLIMSHRVKQITSNSMQTCSESKKAMLLDWSWRAVKPGWLRICTLLLARQLIQVWCMPHLESPISHNAVRRNPLHNDFQQGTFFARVKFKRWTASTLTDWVLKWAQAWSFFYSKPLFFHLLD